ncbi:MAG: hypothetical protein PHG89_02100 [Gallionella sp.]|nr:hypothetical protein [Gallionella sp.]
MAFGEINFALSILDRFLKWRTSRKTPTLPSPETVSARFIRLFEAHGVHRNQIPRFFDYGLILKDVQSDESLLAKLDENMLTAACTRFAVRREWLDGAESQAHPYHDFYKYPKEFLRFLDALKVNNPEGHMEGVLIAPNERVWDAGALLILQETIGHIGDKPIFRHHLCNNWIFSYWKARTYLTACVAIAWKRKVYIHGISQPKNTIDQLAYGETLLGWQGEGIWEFGCVTWHPEDMALQPDEFLNGIDPEKENFSIKSCLKLWLDLEEEGLMDAGIRTDAKQLFQQELTKYSSP